MFCLAISPIVGFVRAARVSGKRGKLQEMVGKPPGGWDWRLGDGLAAASRPGRHLIHVPAVDNPCVLRGHRAGLHLQRPLVITPRRLPVFIPADRTIITKRRGPDRWATGAA